MEFAKGSRTTPGRHPQLLTEAPEAEQADPKLAMHTLPLGAVELPLHRIAEMGGDPFEVSGPRRVGSHAAAVVLDLEEQAALGASPRDPDARRPGIDGIFGELADRLEGMRLRVGDDRDRVPLVADRERAGDGLRVGLHDGESVAWVVTVTRRASGVPGGRHRAGLAPTRSRTDRSPPRRRMRSGVSSGGC